MKKKLVKGGGLLFLMLALVGCQNTVKGVGQDMQQNGKAIEQSIDKS